MSDQPSPDMQASSGWDLDSERAALTPDPKLATKKQGIKLTGKGQITKSTSTIFLPLKKILQKKLSPNLTAPQYSKNQKTKFPSIPMQKKTKETFLQTKS